MPLKIATWNVNGIRARHSQLIDWVRDEQPDVLALQELKASPDQVPEPLTTLSEYWSCWHGCGAYSGVSLHLRKSVWPEQPTFVHPAFDLETRIVQAKVGGVLFASIYVPNGGKDYQAKLTFLEAMARYREELALQHEEVVWCGDLNVAHVDIDVHPSQRNERTIGQRTDERALFSELLRSGFVDIARKLHPNEDRMFTWWPYWRQARPRNLGWRIDYVLASPHLAERAAAADVRRDVGTSDHAPVVVTLDVDAGSSVDARTESG
jgi:exodeoxyribonuclease-3